jgi:hypothetical protein
MSAGACTVAVVRCEAGGRVKALGVRSARSGAGDFLVAFRHMKIHNVPCPVSDCDLKSIHLHASRRKRVWHEPGLLPPLWGRHRSVHRSVRLPSPVPAEAPLATGAPAAASPADRAGGRRSTRRPLPPYGIPVPLTTAELAPLTLLGPDLLGYRWSPRKQSVARPFPSTRGTRSPPSGLPV